MTFYLKSGNRYDPVDEANMIVLDVIPSGVYTVGFDSMRGNHFVQEIDGFKIPSKLYGNTDVLSDRIINTFNDRPSGTGVLLCGEKGSGKTMLGKVISARLAQAGIPTIVVNQPWCGENFNKFVQSIEQPAVMIFDEFEKIYDRDQQNQILTLLDGTYPSKKLFIMTTNDRWAVNDHMQNRPGRFFYLLNYKGLENDFIVEYCMDNLDDKTKIDQILRLSSTLQSFNFDMLKALVEELNRYGESVREALKYLNISSERDASIFEVVSLNFSKERYIKDNDIDLDDGPFRFIPGRMVNSGEMLRIVSPVYVNVEIMKINDPNDPSKDVWHDDFSVNFEFDDIVKFENDTIEYQNSNGDTLIMRKKTHVPKSAFDFI